MLLKDLTLKTPEENIFYDEVLWQLAEKGQGGEVLRFWESPQLFVVLGRISKEIEDVHLERARTDNVPVLRRSSGGGTVLQGPGCLNYSLVLSKNTPEIADLKRSYAHILSTVTQALRPLNIESVYLPISDIALALNRKKFSGNAQKRGRNFILHHGTILYDFDLAAITRYLKMPSAQPEYRQNRSHAEFVTNINASKDDIKRVLQQVFGAKKQEDGLTEVEKQALTTK